VPGLKFFEILAENKEAQQVIKPEHSDRDIGELFYYGEFDPGSG
jgi:hypothetical protein